MFVRRWQGVVHKGGHDRRWKWTRGNRGSHEQRQEDYSREESRWLMGMAEANAKGSSPREEA